MTEISTIIRIVVLIIIVVVFLSLFQFLMSIHPIRYYSKNTPAQYGLPYENVTFTTDDGITIKGWLLTSKKANNTVIVGHGYPFDKGNILPIVKFLYPEYNLLLYDHRYFGESGGSISTIGIKEPNDVASAVKFVQNRFDEKPIALYGFSLSATAMLLSNLPVQAIIADSPYADLERMIKHMYSIFGPLKYPFVVTTNLLAKLTFDVNPRDISPAKTIANSTTPILVIHGEKDSQIPLENAHTLQQSNPSIELWIAKNADHGQAYALYTEEYEKRVTEFLKKHMKIER